MSPSSEASVYQVPADDEKRRGTAVVPTALQTAHLLNGSFTCIYFYFSNKLLVFTCITLRNKYLLENLIHVFFGQKLSIIMYIKKKERGHNNTTVISNARIHHAHTVQ